MASHETSLQRYLEQERARLHGTLSTMGVHGHYSVSLELERVAMMSHFASQLVQIDHALRKLKSGSYGVCEVCQGSINPARLQAFPRATACIACQRRLEQHLDRH